MNEIENLTSTILPPLLSTHNQEETVLAGASNLKNQDEIMLNNLINTDAVEVAASSFVQPQSTALVGAAEAANSESLLSTSYKLFNKNFTTSMKYTNSNLIDINMAMISDEHSIINDTITEGQAQLNFTDKKKLNDLLAAASLSTIESKISEQQQQEQQATASTKLTSSKSKSTYSSSSSTSSNSSSCSSTSSSGTAQTETSNNNTNTALFNLNTNRSNLLMNGKSFNSKATLASTSLPITPSNKANSASLLLAQSKTQKTAMPSSVNTKHSQYFNIENELIKYTKTLKLNGQTYLNTYKLGAHIRNGGFSEIYEGDFIQNPSQSVIIKLIPKHKTKNWLMVHSKKYPAEILLHKMCNSVQGVVKMIEFFEQEHEWIIIMPKLTNCMDLFDYLESKQRGRLSEHEACHFFKQLVKINIDLLNQGVVHRDIKSENLLVDLDTMNLVLIDFGASAIHRNPIDSTTTAPVHFYTDFHGTKQYKPPEYIKHKKYTAQASTIWALGILLYDMCNGQLPFETEQEILEYNLQIKANMSDDYKKILFDCLKPDPLHRPTLTQLLEYSWCIKYSKENNVNPENNLQSNSSSSFLTSKNGLSNNEANSKNFSIPKLNL